MFFGSPMFFSNFWCDPLDLFSPCYDYNYADYSSFLTFNLFYSPWSFPYAGYSPFGYGGFGFYNMGFASPFLFNSWDMPFGSPFYLSSGLSPYAGATFGTFYPAAGATALSGPTALGPWGLATSSTSSTLLATANPASDAPVTLVLTNGTTVRATKYWLGSGQLHYVTAAGVSAAVPVAQLDMRATMKLNERNGVHFLEPSQQPAPGPAPTHP